MRKIRHNPVIGYIAIDKNYAVIGPLGSLLDPAFGSEGQAREAAKRYGQEESFLMVSELHLGGILSVIFEDVGDIQMDGESAQRLVYACQRNGIPLNQKAIKNIKKTELEPKYSCRQMLTV